MAYIAGTIAGTCGDYNNLHGLDKIICNLIYFYPIVIPLISSIISLIIIPYNEYTNGKNLTCTIMVFLTFVCLLLAVKQNIYVFSWILILVSSLSLWISILIEEFNKTLLINPCGNPLVCIKYRKISDIHHESNANLNLLLKSINEHKNPELRCSSIIELRDYIQSHKDELSNNECKGIIDTLYKYTGTCKTDIYNIIEIEALLKSKKTKSKG